MIDQVIAWFKGLFGKVSKTVVEEVHEFAEELVEEVAEDIEEAVDSLINNEKGSVDPEVVGVLVFFSFLATMFAAWVTHIVTCFQDGSWGFLIAGAIAAPVAWVHGVGIWFSWWV